MKLFLAICLVVLGAIIALSPNRKAKPAESKGLNIYWTHYCITAEQGLKVYENGAERKDLTDLPYLDFWSPVKLHLPFGAPAINRIPTEAERNTMYNKGTGSDVMGSPA